MRFVFLTLLFCALAVGCSRKTECHVELRTDEAKETSKLIKSLGGACTTKFDVASFSVSLQSVAAKVTNGQERAELADQYCRELLSMDLLGPADCKDPMEIRGRCDIVKNFTYFSTGTLEGLGMSRSQILRFAVLMCTHLREESKRVGKAVAKREDSKPKSQWGGRYVPWSKCPKMIDDARQSWIWQHIDMPKEMFEHITKDMPPVERERLLKDIADEIGRKPNLF